jgi:nucleotide-binding universal stress UspA family protein
MTASTSPVVVGVDGSEQSMIAAGWAAAEVRLVRAPLHIVVVNDDPARDPSAAAAAQRAAQHCRAREPEVAVSHEVARGHPPEVLLERSHGARLLVVGSHGRGRMVAALLGSISATVAYQASCPVVVVREDRPVATPAPVVVGLDDSAASRIALQFALDAAAARHTELVAVQAWREPAAEYPMAVADAIAGPPTAADRLFGEVQRTLTEQLAGWGEKYPDVPVRAAATRGHPVAVLCAVARDAQLLVVGHRGRGGFTDLRLGSVAAGVLHHADCPVAVVRVPHQPGQE